MLREWKLKLRTQQRGFTLIELMVVIVIIGILVAIALPQFNAAQSRAKDASTKANMSAFRTMVEIYSALYGGIYPADVTALSAEPEMRNSQLFKELQNPYTGLQGKGNAFDDESQPKTKGLLTYEQFALGAYAIYGYDQSASRISVKGIPLIMTNN
ncbi:MAG: type II secretion system protein [Candidatus Sericytochromatia bacterium]